MNQVSWLVSEKWFIIQLWLWSNEQKKTRIPPQKKTRTSDKISVFDCKEWKMLTFLSRKCMDILHGKWLCQEENRLKKPLCRQGKPHKKWFVFDGSAKMACDTRLVPKKNASSMQNNQLFPNIQTGREKVWNINFHRRKKPNPLLFKTQGEIHIGERALDLTRTPKTRKLTCLLNPLPQSWIFKKSFEYFSLWMIWKFLPKRLFWQVKKVFQDLSVS